MERHFGLTKDFDRDSDDLVAPGEVGLHHVNRSLAVLPSGPSRSPVQVIQDFAKNMLNLG